VKGDAAAADFDLLGLEFAQFVREDFFEAASAGGEELQGRLMTIG
jgi:hypothetical protein